MATSSMPTSSRLAPDGMQEVPYYQYFAVDPRSTGALTANIEALRQRWSDLDPVSRRAEFESFRRALHTRRDNMARWARQLDGELARMRARLGMVDSTMATRKQLAAFNREWAAHKAKRATYTAAQDETESLLLVGDRINADLLALRTATAV